MQPNRPAMSIWDARPLGEHLDEGGVPPVLEPEHFDDEEPPVVYVPCQRVTRGDKEAHVELRYTTNAELALLTYTSLKALVQGCGESQPWLSVPESAVSELAQHAGVDVVLRDVPIQDEERSSDDG